MSVNSSSNSSFRPALFDCPKSVFIFTANYVVCILLLLPLSIFVLYTGYQRWRKRRSSSAAAMMSHSDVFTFHMAALDLLGFLGSTFHCYGAYANQPFIKIVGLHIVCTVSPGQALFHLLTCVERYLAVVFPITYLGLRQARGVRIRNISIGCVWFISLASLGLMQCDFYIIISGFVLVILSCSVVTFGSLSVLCALIRPGPGEVKDRERVDQSKQRAFQTIMAIMGALLLRFLRILVSTFTYTFLVLDECAIYLLLWATAVFTLPSSLVLPLLYLHRAGKLPGCKHNTGSV